MRTSSDSRNSRATAIRFICQSTSRGKRDLAVGSCTGLYTASLISGVIGMRLPGPGAVYISQSLNFLGPVKIGDVVDVSVEVVELTEKGRRVRLQCECRVGDKVVLEGQGVLSVPPNPKSRHVTG